MKTNIVMMMFVVLIHNNVLGMTPTKRYEVRDYSRASKQYRIKTKVVKDIIPFKKGLLSEITGNFHLNASLETVCATILLVEISQVAALLFS